MQPPVYGVPRIDVPVFIRRFRGHHIYLRRWSSVPGTPYLSPTLEFVGITPVFRLCLPVSGDTISISDVGVRGHHPCLPPLPAGTVPSTAGHRLERHPEHRIPLKGRCSAMCVVVFETGRALAFVMFEGGRAINDGAVHPALLIPNAGPNPTPPCEDRILSPARLP
jgi:hypothetical protein